MSTPTQLDAEFSTRLLSQSERLEVLRASRALPFEYKLGPVVRRDNVDAELVLALVPLLVPRDKNVGTHVAHIDIRLMREEEEDACQTKPPRCAGWSGRILTWFCCAHQRGCVSMSGDRAVLSCSQVGMKWHVAVACLAG